MTDSKGRRSEHESNSKTECNPFLALCKLASKENWCWKLLCTTCGHMHFRYAFKEIASGKHPDSHNWIVHWSDTASLKKIGDIPIMGSLSEVEQKNLLELVLKVPIADLKTHSKAPDWLGYLGLVMVDCNRHIKELSESWSQQFLMMIPEHTSAYRAMLNVSNSERLLSLDDLELVEFALYQRIS